MPKIVKDKDGFEMSIGLPGEKEKDVIKSTVKDIEAEKCQQ